MTTSLTELMPWIRSINNQIEINYVKYSQV